MPLYIRDDRVKELAERAAQARRTNLTAVVREALERLIEDMEEEKARRRAALDASLARFDTLPDRPWTDADMYDEDGIPR